MLILSAETQDLCDNCNSPLAGTEFFCPTCGKQLRALGRDAQYACRLCGAALQTIAVVCPACGYDSNDPAAVILIVEDNLEIVEMLEGIFRDEGYHSIYASGSDAVVVATMRRPDLILLDLMMPDVSGLEVLERLKTTEQTREIPVVLTSATLRLHMLAREAAADGQIEKPFDLQHLRLEIARLLSRQRVR